MCLIRHSVHPATGEPREVGESWTVDDIECLTTELGHVRAQYCPHFSHLHAILAILWPYPRTACTIIYLNCVIEIDSLFKTHIYLHKRQTLYYYYKWKTSIICRKQKVTIKRNITIKRKYGILSKILLPDECFKAEARSHTVKIEDFTSNYLRI